jgi:TRAP-type C4-dicarboxylate transport system permease small subunit
VSGLRRAELFATATERIAGLFLAVVTGLTFLTVVLRYGFSMSIPDSYDLSRNLLGILIFWGIAMTGFRGEHITVDLLWGTLPQRGRHVLSLLSNVFTLVCMLVFSWAMAIKVLSTAASGETTYDLSLPIWPFYALAWAGLAVSVPLLVLRLILQRSRPIGTETAAPSHSH